MPKFFLFFILPIFIPQVVFGGVIINEIMYDLDGTDTEREWIEIKNNGNEAIDLSSWKLYENKTNHSLNLFKGNDSFIPASGYAVIADNAEKFLADWPEFSGIVFDSSFSLKNDGETLIIKDDIGNDIDKVDYLPEWGAGGDGNSLQFKDGKWVAGFPTSGFSNDGTLIAEEGILSQTPVSSSVAVPVAPQIYAFSGGDRSGTAGSILEFEGMALGLKKEPLSNARFLWNFGDGSSKEGKNVAHIYNYPGNYIVFLDVSSGEYSASSRTNVKIVENKLKISGIKIMPGGESLIELANESESEADLSYWLLKSENTFFSFPKNSIIGAGETLSFASSLTNLNMTLDSRVELLYPNGSVAYPFQVDSNQPINNSSATDTTSPLSLVDNNVISDKDEDKKITEEPVSADTYDYPKENQQANVLSLPAKGKGMGNKWVFLIAGLGVITVSGVILMRRSNKIN